MALQVALQLYTLRDDMAADFEGTLAKVAEMGYAGVEFAGLYGKSVQEVKALLVKYNLQPVSAHVALAEMLPDLDGVMAQYEELGCPYIAVPYLPEEYRPEAGHFTDTLDAIRKCGEAAKAHNMVLLYHNHDFEFTRVDGEYYLDTIYNKIPADLLQTELDTAWVNVGGEDPAAFVRKYTGRAPVVHLKDFYMKGRQKDGLYELIGIDKKVESNEESFGFRPVGHGMQDMPAIIKASEEAGAAWVVVEQDRPAPGQTPMESAELSRQYLKSIGL